MLTFSPLASDARMLSVTSNSSERKFMANGQVVALFFYRKNK